MPIFLLKIDKPQSPIIENIWLKKPERPAHVEREDHALLHVTGKVSQT